MGKSVSDLCGAKIRLGEFKAVYSTCMPIHLVIITASVALWKIQKFDWLIPETK